jgi:hypothetical protein
MNADTIFCIFEYLSFFDIMKCTTINKQFNHVSKNGLLWKKMSERDYSEKIDSNYAKNYIGHYKLYNFLRRHRQHHEIRNDNGLNLSREKLKSIPSEICLMTSLKRLYLRENKLRSLPVELGRMTNLISLELQNNKLESIPSEICSLPNLVDMYLHKNELKSLPIEIGQLTKLIRLDLEYNKLESIPSGLGLLTNLRILCVDEVQLQLIPTSLKNAIHIMYYQ